VSNDQVKKSVAAIEAGLPAPYTNGCWAVIDGQIELIVVA
jgi:hypothetical protein